MTGIIAESVDRSFGAVHAVRGATFEARPGRVTGLVGPNGSGKTTLLLMLASLLAPDAGRLSVGGVDPVADPQQARRMLGWMPDALGAWPALTARETLVTTGRLYDLPADASAARAAQLLALVGLDALADSPARVLSRGQKQKLGLARALVHEPAILLLDEPASGLDPHARVQLRELLRRFAGEGRTVLLSSHILSELEEVVDDVLFLVEGRVVEAIPGAESAREWRIRLLEAEPDTSGLAAALGLAPAAVRLDRGAAHTVFATETDAVNGLRALVAAGVPVVEFGPARSALESAFLTLDGTPPAPVAPPRPPAPGSEEGSAS
ncbi:ABC transporter ATP-binding protein [Microbacterium tumbae]